MASVAKAMNITHRRLLAYSFALFTSGCVAVLIAWWLLPIFAPLVVIRHSPSFHWAVTVYAQHDTEYEGDFAERVARDKPKSAKALLVYFHSPDETLRIAAVKGLAYCAGPDETGALCALLEDSSELVRIYAVRALTGYQDRAMVEPLMKRLPRSDAFLAHFILEALRAQMLTDEELRLLQGIRPRYPVP